MPVNLTGCDVVFLNDGYLVIAYPDTEVTTTKRGEVILTIPVAYYDEEWQWLHGGYVYAGAEPQHVVVEEATRWLASLTSVPVVGL
jgi:hypothetical protein